MGGARWSRDKSRVGAGWWDGADNPVPVGGLVPSLWFPLTDDSLLRFIAAGRLLPSIRMSLMLKDFYLARILSPPLDITAGGWYLT